MEYFTSDWHLNHMNKHGGIIKYCNRPFKDVIDMKTTIYINAFSKLKRGDLLYYLGDFSFDRRETENFFNEMYHIGVQVHFVLGNHDYKTDKIIKERSVWYGDLKSIKIKGQDITLCHYAMRVWPKSHFNAWHLYGHSHGGLSEWGKSWDVGVDNNNFQILSFDDIANIMANQPDNFNLIKEEKV